MVEDVKDPIDPVVPPIVAEQPVKATVPKLASGSIPEDDDGASAIHSAEFSLAPVTVPVVE